MELKRTFTALVEKEHMLGTETASGVPEIPQLPIGDTEVVRPFGHRPGVGFEQDFRCKIERVSRRFGVPVIDDAYKGQVVDRLHESGGMEGGAFVENRTGTELNAGCTFLRRCAAGEYDHRAVMCVLTEQVEFIAADIIHPEFGNAGVESSAASQLIDRFAGIPGGGNRITGKLSGKRFEIIEMAGILFDNEQGKFVVKKGERICLPRDDRDRCVIPYAQAPSPSIVPQETASLRE